MLAATGCGSNDAQPASDSARTGTDTSGPLVVFNAGSLQRPLRVALDTLAAREHFRIEQEPAGSLEAARKITELHQVPDIIALADYEVFPGVLMPTHVSWYARFSRNRMVLAYTERSRGADRISADNWWRVVTEPGVDVGRSDPNLDPAGYRALMVWQLAERSYGEVGLAARLARNSGARNVRSKSADLVALLQLGEIDYAWQYESVARQMGVKFVRLPDAIDLGSPADSASYAHATVRVAGRSLGDTLTMTGAPIVYALSIPREAPHPALAARVVAWLLSPEGRQILRTAQLDMLDPVSLVGDDIPHAVRAAVRAQSSR